MRRPHVRRPRRSHAPPSSTGARGDHLNAEELEERLSAYVPRSTEADAESLRAAFRSSSSPHPPPPAADAFTETVPTGSPLPPGPGPEVEAEAERDTVIDLRSDADRAAAVLGIHRDAPRADIVRAHRELARIHHPDQHVDVCAAERDAAEEAMRELDLAYSVLRRRNSRPLMADWAGDGESDR